MRSGPGAARTILLFHIISAKASKQPLMVRTFLKFYMELGSNFLFLQEQIKNIISTSLRLVVAFAPKVIKFDAYGVAIMKGRRDGWFYEAYEVKNKSEKLRCLILHRKKKNIFFILIKSLLWKKIIKGPLFTTSATGGGAHSVLERRSFWICKILTSDPIRGVRERIQSRNQLSSRAVESCHSRCLQRLNSQTTLMVWQFDNHAAPCQCVRGQGVESVAPRPRCRMAFTIESCIRTGTATIVSCIRDSNN
jgi:hypothetical protein